MANYATLPIVRCHLLQKLFSHIVQGQLQQQQQAELEALRQARKQREEEAAAQAAAQAAVAASAPAAAPAPAATAAAAATELGSQGAQGNSPPLEQPGSERPTAALHDAVAAPQLLLPDS